MNIWDKQRKILWDQVDIVRRLTKTSKNKIIKASFMIINGNCISQISKVSFVSEMWLTNLKEYTCRGGRTQCA